ncbi:MAG: hypothetical protein N2517_04480 [Ignavibacteria bacterium]|nr:hypothetical protein [Ignavibacteria bacterium]
MDGFFYDNEPYSEEANKLEFAVNNAIRFFQNQDFESSIIYIEQAISICEANEISIPNLYLMKAYSELRVGKYSDALTSINTEIQKFPHNTKAYDLKKDIEIYARKS